MHTPVSRPNQRTWGGEFAESEEREGDDEVESNEDATYESLPTQGPCIIF